MLGRKVIPVVVCALLFTGPAPVPAQEKNPSSYPDIGVMDGILQQLLTGGREERMSADVAGSYLPGYGLLFVIDYSGPGTFPVLAGEKMAKAAQYLDMRAFDSSMAAFDSAMADLDIKMKLYDRQMARRDSAMARMDMKARRYDSLIARTDSIVSRHPPVVRVRPPKIELRGNIFAEEGRQFSKEELARIDKQVVKFLASYADAENKLTPGQQVSVVVMTGEGSPARYYTVSRKQISDFRSRSESEDAFRHAVSFGELKNHHDSVGILATILDKSLTSRSSEKDAYVFGPQSTGVYLKGLGAFFVCRLSSYPHFVEEATGSSADHSGTDELENLTIRAIANYGATLRFMPADESIIVLLDLNTIGSENGNVMVSVKKRDADAYSRNELSYDAFRQRAIIMQLK